MDFIKKLVRSVVFRPYWVMVALAFAATWMTRDKKLEGWEVVPARDISVNPGHIGAPGAFDPSQPLPPYVYEWVEGTEVMELLQLEKHMMEGTPEGAAYSSATDFGSNVDAHIWRPEPPLLSFSSAPTSVFVVNPNVTKHSMQTMNCTNVVRGRSITFTRWTWVAVEYWKSPTVRVPDYKSTTVRDACVLQHLCEQKGPTRGK